MMQLQRKKVLLLAPKFYGYENEIIAKLKEFGAEVTYLNDDPSELWNIVVGSLKKVHFSINGMVRRFENKLLSAIGHSKYDIVLVINGQRITSHFTHEIKINNLKPNGKMVLYYWDAIENLKDDTSRWNNFDRILTFDNVDYEEHKDRMCFLPLFYCDKYWNDKKSLLKYDVMIIGYFRLNRYNFIKELEANNPGIRVGYYLYHSKWGFIFHKTFRSKYSHVKYEDLKYKQLSFEDVVDLYGQSSAIIDVPQKGQRGLTIRSLEALAMHKKLITTNENIKLYDFYNPDDVYVLLEANAVLPKKEWYNRPYSIKDRVIEEYSIGRWLEKLLGYDNGK